MGERAHHAAERKRFGGKREMGGVVDSKLKVYGVQELRIVDASIFPMVVAGHTSSTVYAVAEKVRLSQAKRSFLL